MRRAKSTAAGVSTVIWPPASEPSGLAQHPIVADNGSTARHRRLDATVPNTVLERLERRQFRQCAGAVLRGALDEMDEGIVLQPQRHIADTVRLRRLQFGKHR